MKMIALVAAIIGATSFGVLAFWDIADGTKFDRTLMDLSRAPEEFKKIGASDAWGNKYLLVTAAADANQVEYVVCLGPDGRSDSLGHDPDDITRWTDRYSWLDSLHAIFIVRLVFVLSILLFVSSISFHFGRLKGINQRAQQAAT